MIILAFPIIVILVELLLQIEDFFLQLFNGISQTDFLFLEQKYFLLKCTRSIVCHIDLQFELVDDFVGICQLQIKPVLFVSV